MPARLAIVAGALLVVALRAPAAAEQAKVDRADRAWFAGVSLRTDLGTQIARLGGGIRFGGLALNLVVDPFGYYSGTQHDSEVFVEWEPRRGGWALMGGYRLGAVQVLGRRYYQEMPLVGISAPATPLFWGHVRARVGAELALTVVKHGNDLPTVWFFDEPTLGRNSMNFGVFVRFEYGRGI